LGEIRGGVACWITKAAISLKHIEIEEKLLWRAYRKLPTLFRTVPSPTPYGLPFPKIGGSQTHPKTAMNGLQIWLIHSQGLSEHKPIKNLEKRSVGVSRDGPKFFWVPPIISGMGKATNFKFGRYIQTVHANKSPLKIWEKREHGRIQGLSNFFEYPLLSRELVKVRTSNFVRTFLVSSRTKAHYKFRGK